MEVIIKPIKKNYATMRRTACSVGQTAGQIIATSTVVRGAKSGLLLKNLEPQLESSEPLPEFSRDAYSGHKRFESARKKAEAQTKETKTE